MSAPLRLPDPLTVADYLRPVLDAEDGPVTFTADIDVVDTDTARALARAVRAGVAQLRRTARQELP